MWIYVIGEENCTISKIGISKHPEKRLKQLQTGHPEELFIHFNIEVPDDRCRLYEQIIHKENSLKRIRGKKSEWFNLDAKCAEDMVQFVLIRYGDEPYLKTFL